MSSYRSYRPWNSSLSSFSTSNNFGSRYGGEGTSSNASNSKFSSLAPSSYRPSYSSTSGSYRSSRAPSTSSTTCLTSNSTPRPYSAGKLSNDGDKLKSYSRTYSNLDREKIIENEKKTYTPSYRTFGKNRIIDDKEISAPKRFSTGHNSNKNLSEETKLGLSCNDANSKKEEKGPPITFNTRYKSVSNCAKSRDPSPINNYTLNIPQTAVQRISAARNLSREPSPSRNSDSFIKFTKARSRDSSPLSNSFTSVYATTNKFPSNENFKKEDSFKLYTCNLPNAIKKNSSALSYGKNSRDLSPTRGKFSVTRQSKSRDPSPADNKYSSTPTFRFSSEKVVSRYPCSFVTNSQGYKSESHSSLSEKTIASSTSCSSSKKKSGSSGESSKNFDETINNVPNIPQRASFINRNTTAHSMNLSNIETIDSAQIQIESESDQSESSSDDSCEKKTKAIIMIQVTTTTRATSPNPNLATLTRTRRVDIAKTIEKVRQRPLQPPLMIDKTTQSDRMDDSTRNFRYVSSKPSFSMNNRSPTNYGSRTSSSLSSSRGNTSCVNSEKSDSSERTMMCPDKLNFALQKSEEQSAKSEARKIDSFSKSPECMEILPPQSPTKKTSKSISQKVSNKDFRKSALNMGPTDRPIRRSRSSSSENSSPTVEKTRLQFQKLLNGEARDEKHEEKSSSVVIESSKELCDVDAKNEQAAKEEEVNVKIEKAKSFLIKNLGKSSRNVNSVNSDGEANINTEKMLNDVTLNETTENSSDFSEMTVKVSNTLDHSPKSKWPWLEGISLNEKLHKIERIKSGEKAWWCEDTHKATTDNYALALDSDSTRNMWEQETQDDVSEIQKDEEFRENGPKHGFSAQQVEGRVSPDGLESCFSLLNIFKNTDSVLTSDETPSVFISKHTNIDEFLGCSSVFEPIIFDIERATPIDMNTHDSAKNFIKIQRETSDHRLATCPSISLCTEMIPDGNGIYSETSLPENSNLNENPIECQKNSSTHHIPVSSRVQSMIGKLYTSRGKDLQAVLFSLKYVFEQDKNIVHDFVTKGGLECLVEIGTQADQNYQILTLRAIGQVMLYADGMKGVMKNETTIQWLYSLIASKYRLIVKTALKLLLVFVEYCQNNCRHFVIALRAVDSSIGALPWSNIMRLLKDFENADTELLIYATSLINKTLLGLSDQDSFYDETDSLEQQEMEKVIQYYMSKTDGIDLELLDQFQIYETVLCFEDGDIDESDRSKVQNLKKPLRRASNIKGRKSRRKNIVIPVPPPLPPYYQITPPTVPPLPANLVDQETTDNDSSSSGGDLNGFSNCKIREGGAGVTPGLRRHREKAEHEKNLQKDAEAETKMKDLNVGESNQNGHGFDVDPLLLNYNREKTVKDIAKKLNSLPTDAQDEKSNRSHDISSLISKAKEDLEKNKIKTDVKMSAENNLNKVEPVKSEIEIHWEELIKNMDRSLMLCDMDFSDLTAEDEINVLIPQGLMKTAIPPPPPLGISSLGVLSPFVTTNRGPSGMNVRENLLSESKQNTSTKSKKTVKLFWKEVREDMIPPTIERTIWDELPVASVDTTKLEYLFESRAKDLISKKQQEFNKSKEIIVLDHKRSNAINIAMTKLPPPRAIKIAILKMDSTVVTREGIEKLLNMLPTEEERDKIIEAKNLNPELPLGTAEQFLFTLSSISELSARLKLWAFKLDFENIEKEIAEPLMDLKLGIDLLKTNITFKCILAHLLSIGIFLNGQTVKGFQVEYLSKVPEIKDTVEKHSLLHHLCHMVLDSSPNTTDFYSEIGPITRASKSDFKELAQNIKYLETECKASWDRLKLISKQDTPIQQKQKLIDFLADCAERIIILDIVHRRVINRYHKFLLWLGESTHRISESRPDEFCRIISEFSLEYRTTRERVLQHIEKKSNHRERIKTRGKPTNDVTKLKSGAAPAFSIDQRKDAELRQLLENTSNDRIPLAFRRRRSNNLHSPSISNYDENLKSEDDEILESLVKANKVLSKPRERKRSRNVDRKSMVKRSRTREGIANSSSTSFA